MSTFFNKISKTRVKSGSKMSLFGPPGFLQLLATPPPPPTFWGIFLGYFFD